MKKYDIILIGGGIIGISTAWQLQRKFPDAAVLLLEKEQGLAQHQTGRNSGVIHAGVYYEPGSMKAEFCRRGAIATMLFCKEQGVPMQQCGKLLVATDDVELGRMADLERRCTKNSIEIHRLSENELKKREPRITGIGALFVPATGITDFHEISSRMVGMFISLGGLVKTGKTVTEIRETGDGIEVRTSGNEQFNTRYLIACGGLGADRIARMTGIDIDFQIVPFRGEYYQLPAQYNTIVNHLVYPIPDPDLPFLGVHLTRMIDGSVTIGPNAVLGWKREGYGRFNLDLKDSFEMLRFPGFWKIITTHLKSGLSETKDSFYKPGYLKRVRKYCPELTVADLYPYPVGIRAQAVKRDGTLVHDFLFAETSRSFHVCNAPSPAATSAIPIGEYLCQKVSEKFNL
ncbi:MAG: L-2-hydroxyglutarate oxidase [Desulfobulbaceae bacterium]|nr:L-2-hydroxyglutarate oxidase [Desulfobulbaceae bacterium]